MNKVYVNADAAVADIPDEATIMAGGFGLCGNPEKPIDALHRKGVTGLIVVSNNAGVSDFSMEKLLPTHQIKKLIGTYVGENRVLEEQVLKSEIELGLNLQELWLSVFAPVALAFRLSTRPQESEPSSPKGKKSETSTGESIGLNAHSQRTSP